MQQVFVMRLFMLISIMFVNIYLLVPIAKSTHQVRMIFETVLAKVGSVQQESGTI